MNFKTYLGAAIVSSMAACSLLPSPCGLAQAAGSGDFAHFLLKAAVFDPENTGSPSAFFENIDGLLALHMTMSENVAYPPGAAAGGAILGLYKPLKDFSPPLTLHKIAFDLTTDSQNGGGAPRFNIYDNKGDYWLTTCLMMQQAGTTTPVVINGQTSSKWVRITCDPATIPNNPSAGTTPGLPFTHHTVVTRIDIIFDAVAQDGNFANMARVSFNDEPPAIPELKH